MKNIFGVKQKYHQPIKQNQNRFYLIKVNKINKISQKLIKKTNQEAKSKSQTLRSRQSRSKQEKVTQKEFLKFKITFEIGKRLSQQAVIIQEQQEINTKHEQFKNKKPKNKVKNQKLNEKTKNQIQNPYQKINKAIIDYQFQDTHIFPFQKEQVMSIKFENILNTKQYGYALVPIVPFIKLPHIKHQIDVQMVFQTDQKEIRKQQAVNISLQLYFLHNFKSRLFVQPMEADLARNLAQIGQMSPILRFNLRENQAQTQAVDQGGIKPHWQSKKQNEYCYFNFPIQSVFDDLYIYMFYRRQVTMDQLIGCARIDLQQEGIFKTGLTLRNFQKLGRQYLKIRQDMKIQEKGFREKQQQQRKFNKREKGKDLTKQQELKKAKEESIKRHFQNQNNEILYRVQQWRARLISHVIEKCNVVSSKNPPKVIEEMSNAIYQEYTKNSPPYMAKKQSLNETFKSQSVPIKQILEESLILSSKLPQQESKSQIVKQLSEQLSNFTTYVEDRMQETEIGLLYRPVNDKGQQERQKEVGKLKIRYLFVYEFKYQNQE